MCRNAHSLMKCNEAGLNEECCFIIQLNLLMKRQIVCTKSSDTAFMLFASQCILIRAGQLKLTNHSRNTLNQFIFTSFILQAE